MNHKEIKKEARRILKENLVRIILPLLLIQIINYILIYIFINTDSSEVNKMSTTLIINLGLAPLQYGFISYILKIIRNKKTDYIELIIHYREFIFIVSLYLILSLLTAFGFALYIIPGIIIYLMFSMSVYLMVDGEKDPLKCMKKSYIMTKGYKNNLLIFLFSFIGWLLLSVLTIGFLFIYTIPYIMISQAIYYEELKNINKLD